MIAKTTMSQSPVTAPRTLNVAWIEKKSSNRMNMIRFNGLLDAKNSPLALRLGETSCLRVRYKTPIILAALGLILALFIIFLILRPDFLQHHSGYPRVSLPLASNSKRCSYDVSIPLSISWKSTGSWITEDNVPVAPGELVSFLKNYAQEAHAANRKPVIRARMDTMQSAQNFIHLTQCMEEAGIPDLHIATYLRQPTP